MLLEASMKKGAACPFARRIDGVSQQAISIATRRSSSAALQRFAVRLDAPEDPEDVDEAVNAPVETCGPGGASRE
jgi:hypothetical protein